MLDGLSLTGRRPPGDGTADEDDELLGSSPLEITEVTHIGGVGQNHRIRRPGGGLAAGPGAGASEDEEGGDLHRRPRIGSAR